MEKLRFPTWTLLALLIAPSASAQVVINFDDRPGGLYPGNIYADLGVVFSTDVIAEDVSAVGDVFTFDATADPQIEIVENPDYPTSQPNIAWPSRAMGSQDANDLLMDFTGVVGVTSIQLFLDNAISKPRIDIVRLFALEATGNPNEFRILAVDEDTDVGIGKTLEVTLNGLAFDYALFQVNTELEGFDDLTFTPAQIGLNAIALTPLTVAPGGAITFGYSVTNNTVLTASGDLWYVAQTQGGTTVAQGVIRSGSIPAGATVTGTYTQNVPPGAPPGSYTYRLRVGQFPSPVVSDEAFTVQVTNSARSSGSSEWTLSDVTPLEAFAQDAPETAGRNGETLPTEVTLGAAYPNPLTHTTVLGFALPEAGHVRLTIYDVLGREVAGLVDGLVGAGTHTVHFDAIDLPNGTYLVRLETGGQVRTQQVTVVR